MPPPSAQSLIRWPDAFGQRFAVFVDTEEEFDWAAPFSRNARSTDAIAALPAFHGRFAERGVSPCYLCDYPVVTDPRSADALRAIAQAGSASFGAQLHPWVNPPHDEEPSRLASFAGNLPLALQAAKLDQLTDAIEAAIGTRPQVYRAGRYGIGPGTAALLAARGYRIDTSMRARHDYSAEGGPDFSAIGADAFRLDEKGGLIELPLTSVYTGLARRRGPALHRLAGAVPRGRGLLARTGMLSRVPLTPEGVSIDEASEAVRVAIGDGSRLLIFAFHSPSLVPGNTPYVRDAADLLRFGRWWDAMFDLLDRLGVRPASVDDLLRAADGSLRPGDRG